MAIDLHDAHSQLGLRVYLPKPFAMLNTDTGGLDDGLLATDENGQHLFALATSGLSIMQPANVPRGIPTLSPSAGSASGGVIVTLRGGGFVNGSRSNPDGETVSLDAAFLAQ